MLKGPSVSLVGVTPDVYPYLYDLAVTGLNHHRWRFHGTTPSFESFVQYLHSDVLVQFLVIENQTSEPIGHVLCYAGDLRNGTAFLGIVMGDDALGSGSGGEAGLLLTEYLFSAYPLRKLYAEIPEFSVGAVASAMEGLWSQEGILRDHFYSRGDYWDQHLFALRREGHTAAVQTLIRDRLAYLAAHRDESAT